MMLNQTRSYPLVYVDGSSFSASPDEPRPSAAYVPVWTWPGLLSAVRPDDEVHAEKLPDSNPSLKIGWWADPRAKFCVVVALGVTPTVRVCDAWFVAAAVTW